LRELISEFYQNLRIWDTEYEKIRIGPKKDGGYIILEQIAKEVDLLMVFGVGDDIGFEIDFQSRYPKSNIFMYDHTISELPFSNNLNFKSLGISHIESEKAKTLKTYTKLHDKTVNLSKILKIDVEGDEWDIIDKTDSDIFLQYDQIIIEFHLFFVKYNEIHSPYFSNYFTRLYEELNKKMLSKYINILRKIQTTHYIIHAHSNNSLPPFFFNSKKNSNDAIPQLLEITFVKKNLVKKAVLLDKYSPRNGLDWPNKVDRPDFNIYAEEMFK